VDETGRFRPRDAFDDDARRPCGEPAQASLLPGRDDAAHALVVLDGRAGLRERESATGAFATPSYRPSRRCAAARAPRSRDAPKTGRAVGADLLAGARAGQTALRQEQIEHISTLRREL